jgi:hypothetical protein
MISFDGKFVTRGKVLFIEISHESKKNAGFSFIFSCFQQLLTLLSSFRFFPLTSEEIFAINSKKLI